MRGVDFFHHGVIILKIAVVRPGDDEAGKARAHFLRRRICDTGLGTEQEHALALLPHLCHQRRGEVDARQLCAQRRAENFCAVDHADAVRQDKVRPLHGLHGRRIFAAEHHDLRIRRDDIGRAPLRHQVARTRDRFIHRQAVKPDAHYVNSHENLFPPLYLGKDFADLLMDNEIRLIVIRRGAAVDEHQLIAPVVIQKSGCGVHGQRRAADDEHLRLADVMDCPGHDIVVQALLIKHDVRPMMPPQSQCGTPVP